MQFSESNVVQEGNEDGRPPLVALVLVVVAPLLVRRLLQQRDAREPGEQEVHEHRGQHREVLPPAQDGRCRDEEPGPEDDLAKILKDIGKWF